MSGPQSAGKSVRPIWRPPDGDDAQTGRTVQRRRHGISAKARLLNGDGPFYSRQVLQVSSRPVLSPAKAASPVDGEPGGEGEQRNDQRRNDHPTQLRAPVGAVEPAHEAEDCDGDPEDVAKKVDHGSAQKRKPASEKRAW